MKRFTVLIAIALISGTYSDASDRKDVPLNATLCEVLHYPSKFDGKLIRFTARMTSVGLEWVTLSSDACLGVGMGVRTPKSFPGSKEMSHALIAGGVAAEGKEITGIFTGHFELSKDEPGRRILDITRVRILNVKFGLHEQGKQTEGGAGPPG